MVKRAFDAGIDHSAPVSTAVADESGWLIIWYRPKGKEAGGESGNAPWFTVHVKVQIRTFLASVLQFPHQISMMSPVLIVLSRCCDDIAYIDIVANVMVACINMCGMSIGIGTHARKFRLRSRYHFDTRHAVRRTVSRSACTRRICAYHR